MIWIAPSQKDTDTAALEKRLWDAAEQAGPAPYTGLKSQEYSGGRLQRPVGLIFLCFAELRFAAQRPKLESPSPLVAGRAEAVLRRATASVDG